MAATATANACSLFRSREPHTRGEHQLGRKRMGKAFPLAGAKVAVGALIGKTLDDSIEGRLTF